MHTSSPMSSRLIVLRLSGGIFHQQIHRHGRGVVLAHICASLPAKSLHIATFQLSFRVDIPTQAT